MSRAVLSDSASPWTVARQAPLCMGLSRQEYWSGWPSLSPGDLPDPGIGPGSPALQAAPSPSEPRSGVGRCTWTCSPSGGHTPWGLGQHRPGFSRRPFTSASLWGRSSTSAASSSDLLSSVQPPKTRSAEFGWFVH